MPVLKAKAELDDLALTVGKPIEHLVELLAQHGVARGLGRRHRGGVLDEVAKLGVLLLANGRLQRDGLLADLLNLAHAVGRHAHLGANLLRRGVAAQVLQELALHADELVDCLDHVHRDANGTGLIGDGAGNGLANPPRGVCGELEALGVVELLDRTDKAKVALLDEVEEEHAAANIALGDRHHQAQVSGDELLLGIEAHLLDAHEAALLGTRELDLAVLGGLELLGGLGAGLDLHGEVDLLVGGEQVDLANLLEVHAHGVAGEHDGGGVLATRAGAARALGLRDLGLGHRTQGLLDLLGLVGGLGLLVILAVEGVLVVGEVVVSAKVVIVVAGIHGANAVGGVGRLARRGNLDTLGAQCVVEVGELVPVHVHVTDGNLDVVLGHASARLGRRAHQPIDNAPQLVGELDVVLRLLCSSQVIPFDAVTFRMLPVFTARQQQKVSSSAH